MPKAEPWRSMYAPGFPDLHPEHVAEDLRVGAAQPKHPEGGRRQWDAMQGFDSYERLPDLRVPTLVVHGGEDVLIEARVRVAFVSGGRARPIPKALRVAMQADQQ